MRGRVRDAIERLQAVHRHRTAGRLVRDHATDLTPHALDLLSQAPRLDVGFTASALDFSQSA